MRKKTYNEEQLNILRAYYPCGNWDMILPAFPNRTKAEIGAIARKNNIFSEQIYIKNNDITGKKFGKLTAVSIVESSDRFARWKCVCECGNETVVPIYSLFKGTIKSCGCLKHKSAYNAKDFTGKQFGMLTAVERLARYKGKETFYRCICECGREVIVSSGNLSSKHTRSCGRINHKNKEFEIYNIPYDDTTPSYSVYRHISPNGKSYIGITKQDPERRFQRGNGYKTQTAFSRAIEKYGWDNFKHEILEEGLTEKEACEKEAYYIEHVYNSFAPNGYNTREGGINGRNYVTPIIQYYDNKPVNFFESISIASKELNIAQKTIRIHCGIENVIKGYHFAQLESVAPYNIPDEYYELYDENHITAMSSVIAKDTKEKTLARNKSMTRAINQYDLQGHYLRTYFSIAEAQRNIGINDGGAIHAAVNPKRQGETAYGYMWKYDTGDHSDIESVQYKVRKTVLKIENESGIIVAEYSSLSEAARENNVSNNTITRACETGKVKAGYYFKFWE